MPTVTQSFSVEEFHGPYGVYHVNELVLQRIWLQQAFSTEGLSDSEGRAIRVLSPGRWNRLEGPDFVGATLLVDGKTVVGDVEIHFAQRDWRAHGHDLDKRYDNVVLHVVYHPVEMAESLARTLSGRSIPCVSLLAKLWYSLEEYAADDSIVASAGVELRSEIEDLLELPIEGRRDVLIESARRRWDQKRHFASLRIRNLGWTKACHQTAMEVMGYARNRIPMLILAEMYDLDSLANDSSLDVDSLWEAVSEKWRLNGFRPANHPKLRLSQYMNWIRSRPDWPQWVEKCSGNLLVRSSAIQSSFGTLARRKELRISENMKELCRGVTRDEVVGTKANTIACDALLPLCSARHQVDYFEFWFHWLVGDCPASCASSLKTAEVLEPRRIGLNNGWVQGLLGLSSLQSK